MIAQNPLYNWQNRIKQHVTAKEQCSQLIGELFQMLLEINNEEVENKVLRAIVNIIPRDSAPRVIGEIDEILAKYKEDEKPAKRPIPAKQRFRILTRDGFTCQYCGRKAPEVKLQVDHIHPESKGGPTTDENLRTACQECNIGKSNTVLCQDSQTN